MPLSFGDTGKKQIPCGNDRKKSNGKSNGKSKSNGKGNGKGNGNSKSGH